MKQELGLTTREALVSILTLGVVLCVVFSKSLGLSSSGEDIRFQTGVSIFNVSYDNVKIIKLKEAPDSKAFYAENRLFCTEGQDYPTSLVNSFESTIPESICNNSFYTDQSQADRNAACQGLFSGLIETAHSQAASSGYFPPLPPGLRDPLTTATSSLLPNPSAFPGIEWAVMHDEPATSDICSFVHVPSLKDHAARIIQFDIQQGIVRSFDLPY